MRLAFGSAARLLASFSDWLNRACWTGGVAFLVLMLLTVLFQVVARYIFFAPPAWTEELARYCMVWSGFLGVTVAFHQGADPVMITPSVRTSGLRAFYAGLRCAAALAFVVPIVYWSPVIMSHHMLRETESMHITTAYVFMIVPLFSVVLLVHIAARLFSAFAGNSGDDGQ